MRTKRWPLRIVSEGELQEAHAGQPELVAQLFDGWSDNAEVLGDDRQSAEGVLQRAEEFFSWTLDPFSVHRGGLAAGNFPVSFEAAEVVEPDHIEERERSAEAIDPPLVSGRGEHIPAINRISPGLAGGAEVVGRNAGNDGRRAVRVEVKEIGMRPDVGAVMRDVDGNVAHEADAAILTVRLEAIPLPKEFELPIFEGLDFRSKPLRPLAHSLRIAAVKRGVPGSENDSMVRVFNGHKERVVVEPGSGIRAKALEGRAIGMGCIRKKDLRGTAQDGHLVGNDRAKVNGVFREGGNAGEIGRLQQPLLREPFGADEQRIAGEGGETLVGRIAVSGGIE